MIPIVSHLHSRRLTCPHIDIPDLAATEAFGRRLGELLFPGAVVALVGQLGAGKTHLTRAVAEGLASGTRRP